MTKALYGAPAFSFYLSPHGVEQLELGTAGVLPLVGEQDRRTAHAEQGVLPSVKKECTKEC